MITVKYDNKSRTLHPGLVKFRERATEIVNDANESRSDIEARIEPLPDPTTNEMGDPLSLLVILKLIGAAVSACTGLISLIIKLRDLYVSFLSKHKYSSKKDAKEDRLVLSINGSELVLPATDDEIEEFVNKNLNAVSSKA